ncbi:DUF6770 family protein [Chryseolinea lacunae]|uniref:WG repeat-containing protein n=1 Tax=Chryseolinea lacunae TaxID=2801331 RepID=A0ABS1KU61_9BACT|nr:DUF6770 family protein [Chryseolinea lacunae]MBL0742976.1 hypothetical protein [Chryseolinea lacunae]
MKKSIFLLCLIGCLWQTATAQTLSKTVTGDVKVRNTGAILQNGQVKGYYTFYNLEKQDRKNNNYMLSVTDENLREINSVNIVRPNSYLLMDASFNGEAFGFLFYDMRERTLEIIGYDRTLKETNKVTKTLKNKYANAMYAYIAQGHEPMQSFLIAVPNKGFMYYGIKEESKSDFEVEFYDNTMKRSWTSFGPDDKFDFETAMEAFQDEQYVGSTIIKRTSVLSSDIDIDLLVQNIGDGKTVFRIPMESTKYKMMLAKVFFDKAKQQFTIFGEYFDKNENVIKNQSQGFIAVVVDMKGKIVSERTNSWTADINKLVAAKDKETFEDTNILFHDFVRTSDGQIFAIGEQYRRGGNPMTGMRILVYNLVVFQFDADFSIKKLHVFEKDKNAFTFPQGFIIASAKMLSYVAKSMNAFDFQFLQTSADKNTFVVNYINYDREKGQKAKNVLGSVIYTPEKVFAVDKLPLTRSSTEYYVYPAKEGYVMVSEYFKKEKRIDNRLEKLNY